MHASSVTASAPLAEPAARLRFVLLASAAATVLLYGLPFADLLALPLRILSTLVHELGHSVVALLTGGHVEWLQVWPNGSGAAMAESGLGRYGEAVMLVGGLVGPGVAAAVGFVLGRTPRGARAFLIALGGGFLLAEVLLVRGVFGLVVVGTLAAACLVAALWSSPAGVQWSAVFVSVQLALSIFSKAGLLFKEKTILEGRTYVSDVGRIAEILSLPYWFWGLACGAFSLAVLAAGLRIYWGK